MTFSIVARDEQCNAAGIAVASKFPAVGAYCVYAQGGVGAVASQAKTNPLLGIDALDGLAAGEVPEELIARLLRSDTGSDGRQLHMVDWRGRAAAWTGPECVAWAGHLTFGSGSVAGNLLAGPEVVRAMVEVYLGGAGLPFAERLLAAMDAGEAAGGDRRGRQAAAIYIVATEPYPELDLRVDDHTEPLVELRRLYRLSQEELVRGFRATLPRRAPNSTGRAGAGERRSSSAEGQQLD